MISASLIQPMAAKLTSAANSKADLFSLSKWRDGKIVTTVLVMQHTGSA